MTKILCIDQSRSGGYCIFDYENKRLLEYGCFDFSSKKYTYPQAISALKSYVLNLIKQNDISAVFAEDIALRRNFVQSFKCLAQLQGVLENCLLESGMLYEFIPASQWQNFCGARGRSTKEKKEKIVEINTKGKKSTKVLSIQFVHDQYGVDTANDGIADSIGIGHYVVNNIKLIKEN